MPLHINRLAISITYMHACTNTYILHSTHLNTLAYIIKILTDVEGNIEILKYISSRGL